MARTAVYNIDGTSSRKCKCTYSYGHLIGKSNTWLNHWQQGVGAGLPKTCVAYRCRNSPQVGAHVREEGGDGREVWIVPFCQYHNKRPSDERIELKHNTIMCGGSMSKDCEWF